MDNKLYYGDCLTIMNKHIEANSIDMIYLDPPFNSNRNYNAIYKDSTGKPLPEQIEAFCDTWELTKERILIIQQMPIILAQLGIENSVIQSWNALMESLKFSQPKLLAYLSYLTERLAVMKKLLKPTGAIFLHCDVTSSHYIKLLLDIIFGHKNFRNEIIWCYRQGGRSNNEFPHKHDTIFYYSMGKKWKFNADAIRIPYHGTGGYVSKGRNIINGKEYKTNPLGKIPEDWWDIPALNPMAKERLGYPTQKPIELLRRIIQVSTDEGDVVLDPFCGCATTISAAHELKRQWIGIDIAFHTIQRVAKARLMDLYNLHDEVDFDILGIPKTAESAIEMWNKDPFQFQRWSVEMVDGFVSAKKTGDGGVDGNIYFMHNGKVETMLISVKGGQNISIKDIRDLRGTLEKTQSAMAGIIVRDKPNPQQLKNFENEMNNAGFYGQKNYSRMQLLSLDDILNGKKFDTPEPEGMVDSGKLKLFSKNNLNSNKLI